MTDAPAAEDWTLTVVPRIGRHRPTLALIDDRFAQGVRRGVFQGEQPPRDSEALLAIAGDGAALGFATFYEVDAGGHSWLWCHLLWVEEAHRRNGIAGYLLQQLDMIAGERGLKGVMLGRAPDNAAMVALLEQAGWPVHHVVHARPSEGA